MPWEAQGRQEVGVRVGCRQGRSCWAAAEKALPAMLSLNCIWCLLACRETNMKVRQAISVTAELGDTSQLALFDGECLRPALCHRAAPTFFAPSPWVDKDQPRGNVILWLKADLWGVRDGAGSTGMELAIWRRQVIAEPYCAPR